MKKIRSLALLLTLCSLNSFAAAPLPSSEDFKGKPSGDEVTVAGMAGLALFDYHGAFALIGAPAKRILEKGFIPDINNPVFIEAELGPIFLQGTTVFEYGVHLRWDFEKDDNWTFYSIGGFGGIVSGATFGNHSEFYPRFGAGMFYRMQGGFSIRAELSHELTVAGVSWAF